MKECKLYINSLVKYRIKSKRLVNEEVGFLKCWRDGRDCSSNCTAWRESQKKIKCMALPKNKNTSNIIAVLKKGKKEDDKLE